MLPCARGACAETLALAIPNPTSDVNKARRTWQPSGCTESALSTWDLRQ
jgi:hypothetical protein